MQASNEPGSNSPIGRMPEIVHRPSDLCKLCSLPEQNPQNELITPCACFFKAHRNCIKTLIIQRRLSKCPYCSNDYLVGYTYGSKFSCNHKTIVQKCLFGISIYTVLSICFALAIWILCDFMAKQNRGRIKIWEIIVIILLGLALFFSLVYLCVIIYVNFFKRVVVDIELFCSRTEIAKGMEDPQKNLRKFFNWLYLGGYYNKLKYDFPELKTLLRKNKIPHLNNKGGDKIKDNSPKKITPSTAPSHHQKKPIMPSELAGSSAKIIMPNTSNDPNEAVIYSLNKSEEKKENQVIKETEENLNTQEKLAINLNLENNGPVEIIEESKNKENHNDKEIKLPLESIKNDKEIRIEEIVIKNSTRRNKETDTILSVTEEIKSGEVDVANHVLEARNMLSKAKGDAVDDNGGIQTTERK